MQRLGHAVVLIAGYLLMTQMLLHCVALTTPSVTTNVSKGNCSVGQFMLESDCLPCHCRDGCDCDTATGCSVCQTKSVCAVGYTGFPSCQTVLKKPNATALKWSSHEQKTVTFTVVEAPIYLRNKLKESKYHIECRPAKGDKINVILVASERDNEMQVRVLAGKSYECFFDLRVGDDKSEKGPSMSSVRSCQGWKLPIENEFVVGSRLSAAPPHLLVLEVTLPEPVNDCDKLSKFPATLDFRMKGTAIKKSATNVTLLKEIEDSEKVLQPNTTYNAQIEIVDWDASLANLSTTFRTVPVVPPELFASSSSYSQLPGRIDISVPVWNSTHKGNVPPDEYTVLYRLVNTTLSLAWSYKAMTVQNDTAKAHLQIRSPDEEYQYKIQLKVTVYGQDYYTPSPDTVNVVTKPCGEPGRFAVSDIKFIGPIDKVVLQVMYTESSPNCSGSTTYEVEWRGGKSLGSTTCSSSIVCFVNNLRPLTKYTLVVVARNQAGMQSRAEPHTITTPIKTPAEPTNLSFDASDKPKVTVTWDPPQRNPSPVTNYSVTVVKGSKEVEKQYTGTDRTFIFRGELYTTYTVKVRSSNSVGAGLEGSVKVKIPPAKPGRPKELVVGTWNTECLRLSWKAPDHDGGVIESYKGRCGMLISYTNKSVLHHAIDHTMKTDPSRLLNTTICDLISGSQYTCSIVAINPAGSGPANSRLAWTAPTKPRKPSQPVVMKKESTETTITLFLPKADKVDVPASAYFVGVEAVHNLERVPVDLDRLNSIDFADYSPNTATRYITCQLTEKEIGREFVVGQGKYCGGYYNAPLTEHASYVIYYGVEVHRGQIRKQTFIQMEDVITVAKYDGPMDRQVVIAVVASVVTMLLVFIIGVIVVILIRRRGGRLSRRPTLRRELLPLKRQNALRSPDSDSMPSAIVDPSPIPVQHLRSYVMTQQDVIAAQYKALPTGFLSPCTAATEPTNKEKNRFANILPYDHSRVRLSAVPGVPHSDYINANYIDGYSKPHQYIASSGPKDCTSADFWRMIWQQRTTCIVMVTKCVEEGKLKCDMYWPEDKEAQHHGELEVTNTSVETWADFTMNTFSIKKIGDGSSKSLTCHHFHFLSWPDHGVPRNSTPFLLFRRKVKSFSRGYGAPLVVHCSAGVGRTGTFMAIDFLLDQANAEQKVDVFHLVQSLRNQRVSMVQTLDQYRYIYQAVCEALESEDFYYTAPEFQDNYLSWNTEEVIERQFESLREIFAEIKDSDFSVGNDKLNKAKNQNPAIRPHDMHRAYIISQPPGYSSTYINAVFINSYRKKDLFMATQMPLPHTVDDYLRLIYDHEVRTVVALEPTPLTNKKFGVYLPSGTLAPLETDLFTITMTNINDTRADIVMADITLTYKHARGKATHSFRHFQANFWAEDTELPADKDTFVTLLEQVEKNHQLSSASGSICVQCRDGNERTGLLLSVWNALDRLKTEQEVDVYHTVELIRMIRPQAITNPVQYKTIYEMLYTYLQEFDLYANYK